MPHHTKESTSTAASLHSDALSTIASTASSLDARPTSPLAIIDALTGLPLLQKPANAPIVPASPTMPDHLDQSTDFAVQDHLATAELSHPVSVVDSRPNDRPKRKLPPLAPRKKTHFAEEFDDQEERGRRNTSADALRMKSPVIVELRTNVIVKDEYSLVTKLSDYLSTRYQRPQSSIMIAISHSSCLLYGGTFDPGYILTLTAVETYMQSATNKRNTAMLQSFLSQTLNVPPERGVVRFQPIKEDCLGTCGKTVAGEIERVEVVEPVVKRNVTTSVRKTVANALKRRPTNLSIRSNNSPTGSGPKSPYLAEKRRSILSMARSSKEEDRLQRKDSKAKAKRVSLHPPDLSDMMNSPFSSRSSLSVPSPVYIDRADVQPEQQPSTNETATENLLDEAARLLSMHASQNPEGEKSNPEPPRGRTETSSNHPPPATTEAPTEQPRPTADEPARDVPATSAQDAQPAAATAEPLQTVAHGAAGQPGHAAPSHRANAAAGAATQAAKTQPHPHAEPLAPLPTPQPRTPKVSRRKSLLAIFKRDSAPKTVST